MRKKPQQHTRENFLVRSRWILLIAIIGLVVNVRAQQAPEFNKRAVSIIHLGAMEKISAYEASLNQIGDAAINNPSQIQGLSDEFLELFPSRRVMLFNDLDPDHSLSPFYEAETYINNLILWYPDGMQVTLDLKDARVGDVQSHGNLVYSVDFIVQKQIRGNYMNREFNQNMENLRFRVAFNLEGNNYRNFRIVRISSVDSGLVPDDARSLEEVNSQKLNSGELNTVNEGIRSLLHDYETYLLLLGSKVETDEDKVHFRESFEALFESNNITIYNDLAPRTENYLVSLDEYLSILSKDYQEGINSLSLTTDSVLVENVIREENNIYSTYIHLGKIFSGVYRGNEVVRNEYPLVMRISFTYSENTYRDFRIRSVDREAEDLFEATTDYTEPDNVIVPVSRKGLSLHIFGSYGMTRIEDHNLMDLSMEVDHQEWNLTPGYGINAGVKLSHGFNDDFSLDFGAIFNQYKSTWSIHGTKFEDYKPSYDINENEFFKTMDTDYDSAITINLISLPLSFVYTSSMPGKFGMYASAGLVLSFKIGVKYKSTGSWKYYGHYPENPTVIEYIDLEELGFWENDHIDNDGEAKGRTMSLSARASIGLSIPIGYFTEIRIGPEIEYGLSDFNKNSGEFIDIFGNNKTHQPATLVRYGVRLGLMIKL